MMALGKVLGILAISLSVSAKPLIDVRVTNDPNSNTIVVEWEAIKLACFEDSWVGIFPFGAPDYYIPNDDRQRTNG